MSLTSRPQSKVTKAKKPLQYGVVLVFIELLHFSKEIFEFFIGNHLVNEFKDGFFVIFLFCN
jgi:hypothetical protein